MAPPPGYVEKVSYNKGLMIGGLITFGLMYGGGIVYGASEDFDSGLGSVAVPLIGPWIALGKRSFDCDTYVEPDITDPTGTAMRSAQTADECQQQLIEETKVAVVLFGLGLGQLAGAGLATIGAFDRKKEWLRTDLVGVEVSFDAYTSPAFTGAMASGRF